MNYFVKSVFTLIVGVCLCSITSDLLAQCNPLAATPKEAVDNGTFERGYLKNNGTQYLDNSPVLFKSGLNYAGDWDPTGNGPCRNGDGDQWGVGKQEVTPCTRVPALPGGLESNQPPYCVGYINPNTYKDHTTGTKDGFALFSDFNASCTNGSAAVTAYTGGLPCAWYQDIAVIPNQNYYFSAWIALYNKIVPPGVVTTLRFVVVPYDATGTTLLTGSRQIVSTLNPAAVALTWEQFSGQWPSGTYTKARITIEVDASGTDCNNYGDFAIDDISFINSCQNLANINPLVPNLGPGFSFCQTNGKYQLTTNPAITQNPGREFTWYSVVGTVKTPIVTSDPKKDTLTIRTPGTYEVCVYEPSSSTCPAYSTVIVNKNMTVTVAGNDICNPASTTISTTVTPTPTTGTYVYTWTGATPNPGNVASFTATAAGTYGVTVTNKDIASTVCSATDNQVIVNKIPTVGTPATQCYSTTAQITGLGTGTNAANYKWFTAMTGGTQLSTGANPTFTYPATGTVFTVYAEFDATCLRTRVDIPIQACCVPPVITVQPLPKTLCIGATASFVVGLSPTPASTIVHWQKVLKAADTVSTNAANFSNINNTTNSFPLNNVALADSGWYRVVATTSVANCTTNSRWVKLKVNQLPTVTATASTAVCTGGSITLSGGGASTYVWDKGVTNGTAFSPTVTDTYTVTGTDVNGCKNTATSTVTVNQKPIVTAPASTAVCTGTSVTLSGGGAITYVWDNGVTDGDAVSPATTTTYTVTGTDANGCKNTATTTITIGGNPTVTATASTAICVGGSVTLSGAGASTYVWDKGVTNGIAFSPTATETYTVTGTDANGCKNTATSTVTVNQLPVVTATASTAVCTGGSITLSGGGASTYVWDKGVTNGTAFSPTVTDTYTVTGTDVNGCKNTATSTVTVNQKPIVTAPASTAVCTGTSVTLSGGGAITYVWDNGVTDGDAVSPAATTTYTVIGTDANGCKNTAATTITIGGNPTVTATASTAVCTGTSVTLSGGGASTYVWDNGITDGIAFTPASTLTYTVTGTDANGCKNTATSTVTVNQLPVVTATASTAVCTGGSITLSGGGASTYVWDKGVTNGTAFFPTVTDTYTVTGTDVNGCKNTATSTVTVNQKPIVTAPASTAVCTGTSVTLSGGGAITYVWDNGVTDGDAVSPATTTTYTVTGTDANGCKNTATTTITIGGNPTVTATASTAVCTGTSVTLSGGGASTYVWDNGITDGIAFTPASTLTYTVTGTDANGCKNTATSTVTVNQLPVVTATASTAVCTGGSITLSGGGASTYVWDKGVTNGTVFSPTVTDTYTVTGTDANGCKNTATSTVTVNQLPTVTAPASTAVCTGTSVTLSGGGASTYVWDNGVTDGTVFSPTTTNTYTVTGTDVNGCKNTATSTVTVNAAPVITITSAPASGEVCIGGSVTLSGAGAITYVWDNSINDGISFTPNSTTTYTVTGTDANNCKNTAKTTIIVDQLPVITNTILSQVMCGESSFSKSVLLTADIANSTFTYTASATSPDVMNYSTVNAGTSVTFIPAEGITNTSTAQQTVSYLVIVTSPKGCVGTNPKTFTVLVDPPADMPVFADPDKLAILTCKDSYNIVLNPMTIGTLTWSADQISASFSPATGPASTTGKTTMSGITDKGVSYIVTATNRSGSCPDKTAKVTITRLNDLTKADAGADQILCYDIAGQTFLLTGNAINAANNETSAWTSFPGNSINPVSAGGTSIYVSLADGQSGSYRYVYTISNGYCDPDTNSVLVTMRPKVDITSPVVGTDVCGIPSFADHGQILITNPQEGVAYTAKLSKNSPILATATASLTSPVPLPLTISADQLPLDGANTIEIYATLGGDCPQQLLINQATVTRIRPVATIASVPVLSSFNPFNLDGSASTPPPAGPGTIYTWSAISGGTITGAQNVGITEAVAHELISQYQLEVKVNLSSGNTCASIATVFVEVKVPLEFPNVFSPNDDGIHDVFFIKNSEFFHNASLEVFNQWGDKVYIKNGGYSANWNGKYNGSDLPVATYYYIFSPNRSGYDPVAGSISILR